MKYKIFKTAEKTAKENNLIMYDKERLFDFSLLDKLDITEEEKNSIKEHSLKYVLPYSRDVFYETKFNNFSVCSGIGIYRMQRVYSTNGKIRYRIFKLAKIKHTHYERTCVWKEYETTTIMADDGEQMYDWNDIEI